MWGFIGACVLMFFITHGTQKHLCKKHGHQWLTVKNHAKCCRCGHKTTMLTVVAPERKAK